MVGRSNGGRVVDALFAAAGPLRPAYDAVDWASTPLGDPTTWSPTLRGAIDMALNTRFPVTLMWGPSFVMIYNEAYVELIAEKHPAALGAPAQEVFPEAWDQIGPMMQGALAGSGATWVEDEPVPLRRHGFLEDCWFTFSYSPVSGPDGIEGVMDIATETTDQVVARRRVGVLARLAQRLEGARTVADVIATGLDVLEHVCDDVVAAAVTEEIAGPRDDGELHLEPSPDGSVARMSLGSGERDGTCLVLSAQLNPRRPLAGRLTEFIRVFAAALRQAVGRVRAHAAEQAVADAERGIAVELQRSLLTTPVQLSDLQVAVRYWPAAHGAQVGGDWYDAFRAPGRELLLVIGDIAGHDRMAVAAMAQARNLLRGVAQTLEGSPAQVLSALDAALHTLEVDVFATAVLAVIDRIDGRPLLRWSNAGHPPPVLVPPDGPPRLLAPPPNVALGIHRATRADHEVALAPGTAVVFYTDGLVEDRQRPLPLGIERLRDALEGAAGEDAETLCDRLGQLRSEPAEDDVALLVVTAR